MSTICTQFTQCIGHEHWDRKAIPVNLVASHKRVQCNTSYSDFCYSATTSAKNVITECIECTIIYKSATVVLFTCNSCYIHSLSFNQLGLEGAVVAMEMINLQELE